MIMQNKMTNLPQGWEWKSLGEICEVVMGQSPSGNCIFNKDKNKDLIEFHQGKIAFSDKYINKSDFVTSDIRKIAKKNFVVLSVRAPVGEVNIASEDIAIGRGLCSLNGIKINNEFLFFYLLTLKKYFNDNSTGSTFKAISTKTIKETKIPLPPLQEQERIVGILDESFAKIDESIKILEQDLLNLDELMQSALQKAFNPLKDNAKENYKLPQGWEWKSLGEICFITDGTHKTPNYIKTGIPFLSVKNISKGFFDLSDVKYISLEEHNKLIKRAEPEFGDILICRIGTLGKAIKISLEFEFSIFVSLGLLKPKVKIISDYLVYFLNSCFIEGWIDNNKVGGGTHTAKLNLNILEKCPIALPPFKEQKKIASYLDELSSNVKNLKQNYQMQIKNLQELKKSLLDKAFQGRL
ncbi:restriction endonuclease subunit S [Campylobacter sp. RM5063]|uniref:restriction endonuclease subunit S n=1 Tax=Campylobacter sp. RM5063 TaxID=2735747 RepID=UPI00301DC861|nr:restriction endonuclease subunit S [Campylobacter sp. RM5063]